MEIREALAPCRHPSNLRRTVQIALVVGCVLTLVNQLDILLDGKVGPLLGAKIALNFVVPFVVSNLGLLSGRGPS